MSFESRKSYTHSTLYETGFIDSDPINVFQQQFHIAEKCIGHIDNIWW